MQHPMLNGTMSIVEAGAPGDIVSAGPSCAGGCFYLIRATVLEKSHAGDVEKQSHPLGGAPVDSGSVGCACRDRFKLPSPPMEMTFRNSLDRDGDQ